MIGKVAQGKQDAAAGAYPGVSARARVWMGIFHFHVREAFAYNPFLVISLPYLSALALCRWFDGGRRFARLKRLCHHPLTVRVYLLLLVAWWVGRNLWL